MTGDIATRLRTLYNNLVISLNFIIEDEKTLIKREFFDTTSATSITIDSTTYASYAIQAGKIYDTDFTGVTNPMFNLTTAATLLTAECPEWHFFFTAGSDAPAWARTVSTTLSGIEIHWANTPNWTEGTRYEVIITYINNGNNSSYEGVFIEQEAAS